MNYIIIDFEASCWKHPKPRDEQEIIEIGAIRLDPYGHCIDQFKSFVKPVIHPVLSYFCIQLTGIHQENVDRAKEFPFVYAQFLDWLDQSSDYRFISWGAFDESLLKTNCEEHGLELFWNHDFTNIKKQYSMIRNLPKPIGLKRAVENEKFEFDGNHHRALDDAFNTAKIFSKFLDEWTII